MVSSAADLIRQRLGAPTYPEDNRLTSTVGVAAQQVLKQSPARVWLLIVNLSASDIYVAPFPDVSTSKGILLSPAGGSLSLNYVDDMDLVSVAWFAIATGAASNVLIEELLIDSNNVPAIPPTVPVSSGRVQ